MSDYPVNTKVLDLSSKNLNKLPKEVANLKKLKVLFLSNNNFTSIPSEISKLKQLEFLGMKSCKLASIDINSLPKNLRWLTLTDNKIEEIPKEINQLTKLEKLLLAGNKIKNIPEEISYCKNLALIRISANKITKSPFNIIKKLPNLAWYADSGNPFSLKINNKNVIRSISWDKIHINSLIGESAQNKIYAASVEGISEKVAIKVFGSNVNSDGYPQDDMNISMLAGKHKNIVETLFIISNVPENSSATALKIISKEFFNLGLSPSFETCYRDTFSINKKFSIDFILNVLKETNNAYIHLHQNGIMNGDLYAHNILTNNNGESFIGDFGAASLYDKKTEPERELIDVKAFGYLIDDLINQSLKVKTDKYMKLEKIKNLCLTKIIDKRPDFKKISLLLNNI